MKLDIDDIGINLVMVVVVLATIAEMMKLTVACLYSDRLLVLGFIRIMVNLRLENTS